MGNQSAAQYIQAPTRDAAGNVTNARPVAAKKAAPPTLKPLVAGKPNPNIGQGLKTSADLPQFGEQGWVNPNYDPNHNANGYHRFDPTIPGMGMQMSKDYAAGARTYDAYQKIAAGAPGSSLARDALTFMTDNGIDPARSNDIQKFAAMDYAGRHVQWKNQRPKRKFTLKQAFGTAVQIVATIYGGPWGAAAGGAFATALNGGDLGDIAKAAVIAGATAYAGGKIGDWASSGSAAGSAAGSTAASTAASAGSAAGSTAASTAASAASTLGKIATGVGTAYKTVGPYLNTGLQVGGILANDINKSGVLLTPTQNNALKGGRPAITTYAPENKNIALSPHPTSAYQAAYPGLANVANAGTKPINAAPIAPINMPGRPATPYAPPAPYVAPTPAQVAPNIDIVNYDPSRNYPQSAPNLDMFNYGPAGNYPQVAPNIDMINYDPSRNYPQATTMQQALTRPAATRAPASNATAA
jgi:hypothetical protein